MWRYIMINTEAQRLKNLLPELHAIPVDALIEFFDALSAYWLEHPAIHSRIGYVRPLAEFIRKDRVIPMLTEAFRGDYHVLDRTVNGLYCQPRGLVVHWLAGNAALLGCYSLVQAFLTKNVSLVKPSSRAHEDFEFLLNSMRQVKTPSVSGEQMRSFVSVILVDRTEQQKHAALSLAADVRIAWGGEEAVQAITSLPKSVHCEDIIFGPKYSFGIVDVASMHEYESIAKKIALDVCTFDQFACSSPHTIFVEEGSDVTLRQFAQSLADALAFVGKKFIQKEAPGTKKQMDILTMRAKYAMIGDVIASDDTEWTVVITDEAGFSPACGSRVLWVKSVPRLDDVVPFVNRRVQTLGMAVTTATRDRLLDRLTLYGIDRCVPFGTMTLFDSPWDGMFVMDRLVRWVNVKHV